MSRSVCSFQTRSDVYMFFRFYQSLQLVSGILLSAPDAGRVSPEVMCSTNYGRHFASSGFFSENFGDSLQLRRATRKLRKFLVDIF